MLVTLSDEDSLTFEAPPPPPDDAHADKATAAAARTQRAFIATPVDWKFETIVA